MLSFSKTLNVISLEECELDCTAVPLSWNFRTARRKDATCEGIVLQALFDIGVRVAPITRVRSQTGGRCLRTACWKSQLYYLHEIACTVPGGAKVKSRSMLKYCFQCTVTLTSLCIAVYTYWKERAIVGI